MRAPETAMILRRQLCNRRCSDQLPLVASLPRDIGERHAVFFFHEHLGAALTDVETRHALLLSLPGEAAEQEKNQTPKATMAGSTTASRNRVLASNTQA